jgi:hypothetical protein
MTYNPQNPNGQATSANSQPVVLASDQTAVPVSASSLPLPTGAAQDTTLTSGNLKVQGNTASGASDAGNPVKVGGVYNSAAPTFTNGQRGDLQLDASGNLKVASTPSGTQTISGNVGLNAGSNLVGSVQIQDANNNQLFTTTTDPGSGARGLIVRLPASNLSIGSVNLTPSTTGGWSVSSQTSLTTSATVSSAAGKFGGYMFNNTNNSAAYIQVFDTTGTVTLGTTTPTFVVPIPAGGAANVEFANGIAISSGIKVAATTTATGATTVATGLTGFVLYK